jgi:hypothetical protein
MRGSSDTGAVKIGSGNGQGPALVKVSKAVLLL